MDMVWQMPNQNFRSYCCGGVAILWKSSLPVTPVTAPQSDQIATVQVPIHDDTSLLIISVVPVPTADLSTNTYKEYLIELENAISVCQSDRPVLVLGDFDAHLGSLCGVRGSGDVNAHGQLLMDLICHTNLYTVLKSHCNRSSVHLLQWQPPHHCRLLSAR